MPFPRTASRRCSAPRTASTSPSSAVPTVCRRPPPRPQRSVAIALEAARHSDGVRVVVVRTDRSTNVALHDELNEAVAARARRGSTTSLIEVRDPRSHEVARRCGTPGSGAAGCPGRTRHEPVARRGRRVTEMTKRKRLVACHRVLLAEVRELLVWTSQPCRRATATTPDIEPRFAKASPMTATGPRCSAQAGRRRDRKRRPHRR